VRRPGRHAARPAVRLTPVQAATVLRALADAEAYRRQQAAAWCADCTRHPAACCDEHVADLDQADVYAALADGLGLVPPPEVIP
jgi:hypothetical protein